MNESGPSIKKLFPVPGTESLDDVPAKLRCALCTKLADEAGLPRTTCCALGILSAGQATTLSATCAFCGYSPRACKHHRKPLQTTIEESVPDEETESGMSLAADTPPTVDDDASSESTCDCILDPLGDVKFTMEHLSSPSATGPSEAVSFLASSRHLILASPVFEQMLEVAGDADVREIESDCPWQVEATIIIMRILHHKWSLVPREVDLDLLGDIAMAVERYELYEAVQVIGRVWIERLQTALPDSYGRELKLGSASPGRLGTLLIPHTIISDIDSYRRKIPYKIAQFLGDLKRKFISGEGGCNEACMFMQLGALVKNMHDLELVDRNFLKPLRDGLSPSDFISRVREIETPVWYENASNCTGSHYRGDLSSCLSRYEPHRCKKTDSSSAEQLLADEATNMRSEEEETPSGTVTYAIDPNWDYPRLEDDPADSWGPVAPEEEYDDQVVAGEAGISSEEISGDSYGESVLKESIRDLVRKMECEMEGLDLRNYT
ncbi:hypothetical protein QBC42DRAFT_298557 [Cladorrhinum samala]|uniref:BTB domain-containing protein n=1 Tax=Cladorrhinum samala TaxID=585594 RepID=A0AAV9HI21_9PEZI|nr:hypothetical protein QBC42DRAFT_298557 [Cladorrhinum samala]